VRRRGNEILPDPPLRKEGKKKTDFSPAARNDKQYVLRQAQYERICRINEFIVTPPPLTLPPQGGGKLKIGEVTVSRF